MTAWAPLGPLQRRMWHVCTAYSGDASPIVFLAYRLRGPLDILAFTSAVSEVFDRHAGLRLRFKLSDEGPMQTVEAPSGLDTELEVADDLAQAEARVAEMTGALLDLVDGPLVRSRLIRLSDVDHVWCVAMHHILADGASMGIFARELRALYEGKPLPPVEEVPVEPLWPSDLEYWLTELRGVPLLELPADFPRPEAKGTRSVGYEARLDLALTRELEQLATAEQCSLFTVLLAAFQLVLGRSAGAESFCVGVPVSGRTSVEAEGAIGLYGNMLAIRADLSGEPTFLEVLRRTRLRVFGGLGRQTVPFGQIVGELSPPADPSRTQVFQVIFSLHTEGGEPFELPDVVAEPIGVGNPQSIHDLVLDAWRDAEGVCLAFRYDSGIYTERTAANLATQLERVLRSER